MTDLLLRQVEARAGAERPDDYDVIGPDGLVIGRISKTTTAPAETPWIWTLTRGARGPRPRAHARGRNAGVRQELGQRVTTDEQRRWLYVLAPQWSAGVSRFLLDGGSDDPADTKLRHPR
jgi:hypothetical protein